MNIFKKKKIDKTEQIDLSRVPKHIGFIMDGNGRWAKKRGLPRTFGHKEGVNALNRVLDYCNEIGVEIVSVYAFSTENFKRENSEVAFIFSLIETFVTERIEHAIKNDTKILVMGNLNDERIPLSVKKALETAVESTKHCKTHIFNLGFSYGGRAEIIEAVNKIIDKGVRLVDEKDFSQYLYTSNQPDPDLIVRASGEQRISNFMLWQMAYSEFYFPETHWPDFNADTVKTAVVEFQKRDRRFGNIKVK